MFISKKIAATNNLYKIIISTICAMVASLATFPYGLHFARLFVSDTSATYLILGAYFALSAVLANIFLGTYSLLNVQTQAQPPYNLKAAVISILGATPVGFVAFFGYQQTLPFTLNVLISSIVTLVNAAINYTAIENLLKSVRKLLPKNTANKNSQQITLGELVARVICAIIGVLVSLFGYLAAVNGLIEIFVHYQLNINLAYRLGFILGIIAWLPSAALFSNTTQLVGGNLYNFLCKFRNNIKKIGWQNVIFLIFILGSGGALAQMILEFFAPDKYIPEFFKLPFIQSLVYFMLMPMAYFASVAVNHFALKKIINLIKS